LVDLARISPSARNAQPLRFVFSNEPKKNALIFKHLAWAGSLKDWPGPDEGERPAAYIIILGDREISPTFGSDHGIASQSILLGAVEKGLGGCIIGSIQRPGLQVVLEAVGPDGDTTYYRDEAHVHHVPKRAVDDLIFDF
jgi:nitroreductase